MLSCLSLQAQAVRPYVVYGEDNRKDYYAEPDPVYRRASESTVALIRAAALNPQGARTKIATVPYGESLALCPSEPFYAQRTAPFCSGFLVAPDLVATAGHCIPTASVCENTRMVFGFRLEGADQNPSEVPTENVYACKTVLHTVSTRGGEDFALVRLDRPVTVAKPLKVNLSRRVRVGDAMVVMGHPSGLPLKIAAGANVRLVAPEYFVGNFDTFGGNSGSAVLNAVTADVEGILVRGERDFQTVNGCRVSFKCADDQCRGEDVTHIDRLREWLPPARSAGGKAKGR